MAQGRLPLLRHGCGLQVGVRDGRIVATKGDPEAPVNRGLNCVKGYFNAKIMYGRDRLTQPLMRRTNGRFDKNGKFEPVSWDEAFDEMARQFKRVYAEKGPSGVALVGSGQYTIPEAYAASKLWKGGFRSNNIDPNARLCMASAVVGFYQTFGVDEPANHYGDIELADTMILWGNNMAEAHPVLWSRVANRKLTAPATKLINLTTYRNMVVGPRRRDDHLQAQRRPRHCELPDPRDHQPRRRRPRIRSKAHHFRRRRHRHRLRPSQYRQVRLSGRTRHS